MSDVSNYVRSGRLPPGSGDHEVEPDDRKLKVANPSLQSSYDDGGVVQDDDNTPTSVGDAGDRGVIQDPRNEQTQTNDAMSKRMGDTVDAVKGALTASGDRSLTDMAADTISAAGRQMAGGFTAPDKIGRGVLNTVDAVMSWGRKKHNIDDGSDPPTSIGDARHRGVVADPKTTLAYLSGAGANPPEEAAARVAAAAGPGVTPAVAKAVSVANAAQEDPAKGWGQVQYLRQLYDANRVHAAAGLAAGNLPAAALSASQMFDNMPDGNTVQFVPGQGGITATVTRPGEQRPYFQIQYTPQQFQQLLHGPAGQFDAVYEKGMDVVLKSLQNRGANMGTTERHTVGVGGRMQDIDVYQAAQPGDKPFVRASNPGDDKEIVARANRMFPNVDDSRKREAWINEQGAAQGEAETKKFHAEHPWGAPGESGESERAAVERYKAQTSAGARAEVSKNQVYIEQLKAAAAHADAAMRVQLGLAQTHMKELKFGATPEQFKDTVKAYGITPEVLQGQASAAPQVPGAVAAPSAPSSPGTVTRVNSKADYDALPSGAKYMDGSGRTFVKK